MRPHRLTLQALGPFASEVSVDFDDLSAGGLFAICGETGSGKTALFDAVAFGLYGTASGSERDARELRSDYAPDDVETFVEMEFSIGPRRFRVRRSPRYQVARRDGQGRTDRAATAMLWELSGGETVVRASRPTDVDACILDWMRIDARQYRQTGILPQGEFRKVITGKAVDREGILRQLFDTWRFNAVEQRLRRAKTSLDGDLAAAQTTVQTLLEGAGVETDDELASAVEAAGIARQQAKAEVTGLAEARSAADAALDKARAEAELLSALERADKTLATLEAKRPAVEALNRVLDAANRARKLADLATARVERRQALQKAQDDRGHAADALAKAAKALSIAEVALDAREAQAPRRDALRDSIAELRSLDGTGVDDALRTESEARTALEAATTRLAHATAAEDEASNSEDVAAAAWEQDRRLADDAGDAELRRRSAEQRLQARRRWEELGQRIAEKRAQLAHLEETAQARGKAQEAARTRLDEALDARFRAAAASLADDLEEGEPCSVCGSPEHPRPARHQADGPDQTTIETLRSELQTAESQARETSSEREATLRVIAGLDGERTGLDVDPEEPIEVLEKALEVACSEQQRCAVAAKRLPVAEETLSEARAVLEAARRDKKAAERLRNDAAVRHEAAAAVSKDQLARVPERLRSEGAIAKALTAALAELEELSQGLETARTERAAAMGAHEAAKAHAEAAGKTAATRLAEAEAAAQRFASRRESEGFTSDAAYEAAIRDEAEREQLSAKVESWTRALQQAVGHQAEAASAAEGLVAPDLDALTKAFEQAVEAADLSSKRLGAAETAHKTRLDQRAGLERARARFEALEAEHRIIAHLAETATGKNPRRLTFERYVMAALLDEVLVAANHRLAAMTGGQFVLSRREEGGRGGRGLDLDVLDHYTGSTRRAGTLSGGEGFIAALSLALGLADTVQSQAGGVHLESIFVDEGFGSLGPEALDRVLGCLEQLGEGRMVGVVSHVTEVRERLPGGLVLQKSPVGSSIAT